MGWDVSGTIIFNDAYSTQNYAENNGGCFNNAGRDFACEGTAMLKTSATNGGSIGECNRFCSAFLRRGSAASTGMITWKWSLLSLIHI